MTADRGRPALIFKPCQIPVDANGDPVVGFSHLVFHGAIYVDDVRHEHVIEANEVEGFVLKLCLDDKGRMIIDGDQCEIERVEGFVHVRTK